VTGQRPLSAIEERLQEVRRNLDGLLLKYTENYFDVKAALQAIAQLQAEAEKSSDGGTQGSGNATGKGQITNSVYDQIKVKLVDAESVLASVQRRLAEAQAEQGRIEKIAQSAPGVLVQAEDLNRDYGVLKKNYEELVARAKRRRSPTRRIPRPRRSNFASSTPSGAGCSGGAEQTASPISSTLTTISNIGLHRKSLRRASRVSEYSIPASPEGPSPVRPGWPAGASGAMGRNRHTWLWNTVDSRASMGLPGRRDTASRRRCS
jgi:hypothetical protein